MKTALKQEKPAEITPKRRMRTTYKGRSGAARSLPQRTCVACRRTKAKKELIRLVRTPGGEIEIDTTGKKEGRGAYLCPSRECWEKGLKGNTLEHTLKGKLTENNREQLIKYGTELLEGVE